MNSPGGRATCSCSRQARGRVLSLPHLSKCTWVAALAPVLHLLPCLRFHLPFWQMPLPATEAAANCSKAVGAQPLPHREGPSRHLLHSRLLLLWVTSAWCAIGIQLASNSFEPLRCGSSSCWTATAGRGAVSQPVPLPCSMCSIECKFPSGCSSGGGAHCRHGSSDQGIGHS